MGCLRIWPFVTGFSVGNKSTSWVEMACTVSAASTSDSEMHNMHMVQHLFYAKIENGVDIMETPALIPVFLCNFVKLEGWDCTSDSAPALYSASAWQPVAPTSW